MLPLFLRSGVRDAGGFGWPRALVLILLAGPIYNMVLIGGLTWAPATHSSLIYPAFTPLFTALLAKLMLDRRENLPLAGLAMLIGGVLTIKLDGFLHPATSTYPHAWRGDLLFMTAALMWSFYTVLMRRWNTKPLAVVSVVQVGGLFYVPLYFAVQGFAVFRLDITAIAIQSLYQGVLVSVISILLFNLAVRQIGAKASMFTAVMPVVGVSLAVVLLNEPVSASLVAGTLLIVAGLFVSMKNGIRAARTN